jgi:uncharacterized membrane protein
MTDQELARALFEAGILTQEQVQTAAAQRSPGRNFAQIVVGLGWVTPAQIAQFDTNALGAQATMATPMAPPMPPPQATPWQSPGNAVPNPGPPPGYNAPYGTGYPSLVPPTPEVRISAIGEAWKLVSDQLGTWVAASLIYMIACAFVYGPMYASLFASMRNAVPGQPPEISPLIYLWTYPAMLVVVSVFFPGFCKMALKQIDGYPITVGDVFSGLPYMGRSIITLLLYYIAVGVGFLACCVGSFVASAGLFFAIHLVIDRDMGPIDALQESWNTLKSHLLMMFAFLFLTYLCGMLGYLACGIGLIFSLPIMFIAPMIVYRDFYPAQGAPPQDQSNLPPPPIPSPF